MKISTGFKELDNIINIEKSDLILLASRPTMGKTTLALNIASNLINENIPTLIFSLDISKEQAVNRIITSRSLITLDKIRTRKLNVEEWTTLGQVFNNITNANLYISKPTKPTIEKIENVCRNMKKEKNIDLVIIDYLQLLDNNLEMAEIIKRLKALGKELDIAILVLSQLSLETKQRTNHRPLLSDLTNDKNIINYIDSILFLYRDIYYNTNTNEPNIAEILIAKSKNNKCKTVKLKFMSEYFKFDNIISFDQEKE